MMRYLGLTKQQIFRLIPALSGLAVPEQAYARFEKYPSGLTAAVSNC